MATPAYSRRLAEAQAFGASSSHVLFTVPAGYIAVVRSITTYCFTAPGTIQFQRQGTFIYTDLHAAAVGGQLLNDLRWIFNPGEVLLATNASGDWNVSVHGYLITL